jgi:hypothetical protein
MKTCRPVPLAKSERIAAHSEIIDLPDKRGGLNGSTQHSSRTRLALKTKAKSLARVRSAGTLPWLGFDQTAKQITSPGEALSNQRIGWCCIDRLSRHDISGEESLGSGRIPTKRKSSSCRRYGLHN